jgi:hypothetical protein
MCDKCSEHDEKIARYQGLAMCITDRQTLDGIASLIEQTIAAKLALHPEPKEK